VSFSPESSSLQAVEIKVLSLNLNCFKPHHAIPYEEKFFRTSNYDVVLLQEVRRSSFERIRRHFDWGFLSLGEQDRRRIGVAILGRTSLIAHSPESIGAEVFEQNGYVPTSLARWFEARNLSVLVDLAGSHRPVRLMTAHATPGTSRGPRGFDEPTVGRFKPVFHSTLAQVIKSWDSEFIFSLDANSPKVDSADWSKVEFYREVDATSGFREAHLLGPDSERCHQGRDLWRHWLSTVGGKDMPVDPVTGPLAVSYRTRDGRPFRYDHLYGSSGIEVRSMSYQSDDKLSDHARIEAILEVAG
jgi:exonuclease III